MDYKYEVTVVPVSDLDRAKDFYAEQLGFTVDVDHRAGESFRVVQLTPPGSAASISIGTGISRAPPTGGCTWWSRTSRPRERISPGVEWTSAGPFHFGAEGQTPGLHPERADYGTYLSFSDPDGNGWLVQEVRRRAPGR